jgi:hypothetical protein
VFLARLDADLRRFYRLTIDDVYLMPTGITLGLIESLPSDAMIYTDEWGRPLSLLLAGRQVEVTFEIVRVVLMALGVKRNQLPKPLSLMEMKPPAPDARSLDPRAWSAALGAQVVKV